MAGILDDVPATSRARLLAASSAIYLFWGSAYLAMRIGLRTIPPLVLAGSRLLGAGVLMGGFALLRSQSGGQRLTRAHLRSTLIAGAILFLGGHGFLYWGQQRVPSGIGAVLFATIPLWIVLIEGFSPGGIQLGWRAFSGLALGMAGILLLVGPTALLGSGRVDIPGAIAISVGSLCWAVGSIFCTRAALPASGALAGGLEMLWGGLLLLAAALPLGEYRGFHWGQVSAASFEAVGFLVLFSSMIGFSCYLWLLKRASAARVSTYAYITPLVAVGLGWALAGERITPRVIAAIGLLLSAVVLIVRTQSKAAPRLLAAEAEAQGAVAG